MINSETQTGHKPAPNYLPEDLIGEIDRQMIAEDFISVDQVDAVHYYLEELCHEKRKWNKLIKYINSKETISKEQLLLKIKQWEEE